MSKNILAGKVQLTKVLTSLIAVYRHFDMKSRRQDSLHKILHPKSCFFALCVLSFIKLFQLSILDVIVFVLRQLALFDELSTIDS